MADVDRKLDKSDQPRDLKVILEQKEGAVFNSLSAGGAGEDVKTVSPQKRKAETEGGVSALKMSKPGETVQRGTISMSLKPAKAISMNLGAAGKKATPIKMSLGGTSQLKKQEAVPVKTKSEKVAAVFNEDSDSDEEMPIEAKMRMRNVGRETPTAAGPNSFGKGNIGFCDRTKMIERDLKRQMEELGEENDRIAKT